MPITPQHNYERIWQLATQFTTFQAIKRSDLDLDLNDIAEALSSIALRTNDLEDSSIQPSGNLILNPEFAVNTLNYSGAPLGIGDYGHNRWKSATASSQYTVVDDVVTINSGSIAQLIDKRSVVSGIYTMSFMGDATCIVNNAQLQPGETIELEGDEDVIVEFGNGSFSYPYLTIGSGSA